MVGFGLLAAGALAAGRRALEKRSWRLRRIALALELALVVGVALDICLTNQRVIQQGLDPRMPQTPASADFFQNTGADYSRLPTFPVQGFGTRACYVALEWKPAPGITDGRGAQARVEPPAAGTVAETSWSPNRLELDVRLDAPATVIINQNYETGWRAKDGKRDDGPATVGAYVVPQQRFWDIRGHSSGNRGTVPGPSPRRLRRAKPSFVHASCRAAGQRGDRASGGVSPRRRSPPGADPPTALAVAGRFSVTHRGGASAGDPSPRARR